LTCLQHLLPFKDSRTTCSGFLSSRQPRNVAWRSCSSAVISANATSQTSLGCSHWTFSLTFGGLSKGDRSVKNGLIRSIASFSAFSLMTFSNSSRRFRRGFAVILERSCQRRSKRFKPRRRLEDSARAAEAVGFSAKRHFARRFRA